MPAGEKKLIAINFKYGRANVKIGSKLTLNSAGEDEGLGTEGDIVEVSDIILGEYDRLHLIRCAGPHPVWSANGTRFLVSDIQAYFDYFDTPAEERRYHITKDVVLKKRNLKGLGCKIVARLNSNDVFVEFEEDVGGCSCDGLGKRGHCIAVHSSCIGIKTESKKTKEE